MGSKSSHSQKSTSTSTSISTSKPFFSSAPKKSYAFIKDQYKTYEELEKGLREAGLEACQLIVGIDFTRSNTWQGGTVNNQTYYEKDNLHSRHPYPNPYQHVLQIMCKSLANFDNDGLIPAYGFGDTRTTDRSVFSFYANEYGQDMPCLRLEGVLERYNQIITDIASEHIKMSGPTSFAPLIYRAIEIVKQTKEYHILLIVCDGAVDKEAVTIEAIVEASKYPLSIICIGVGRGPWDVMEKFDDNIPERDFDNFQFVNFHEVMTRCESEETNFAHKALMEIPDQFEYIRFNLLSKM